MERIDALEADLDTLTGDVGGLSSDIATIEADYLVASDLTGLATESYVDTELGDITPGIDDLDAYLNVDPSTDSVVFSAANVYVQSGSGTTHGTTNGLGNLIVGYDEDNGDDKTGSHNLIVGRYHTYSSYGGIVGGRDNAVTGSEASVLAGLGGVASGNGSAIISGVYGESSGDYSAVVAGFDSMASGTYAAAIGGAEADAAFGSSVVLGGYGVSTTRTYEILP